MSSIGGTLAISEQTIVGTGSYIIPANRYGGLEANTSISSIAWMGNSSSTYNSSGNTNAGNNATSTNSTTASSNNMSQQIVAGDSITVQSSYGDVSRAVNQANAYEVFSNASDRYARVLLNGTVFCESKGGGASRLNSVGSGPTTYIGVRTNGITSWSVSLYRIPIANLPQGAAEGES